MTASVPLSGVQKITLGNCGVCQTSLTRPSDLDTSPPSKESSIEILTIDKCGHVFHDACLRPWIEGTNGAGNNTCPLCRATIAPATQPRSENEQPQGSGPFYPTTGQSAFPVAPITVYTNPNNHEEALPPGWRRIPVLSMHPENSSSSAPLSSRELSIEPSTTHTERSNPDQEILSRYFWGQTTSFMLMPQNGVVSYGTFTQTCSWQHLHRTYPGA